jgi:hypothetical protein
MGVCKDQFTAPCDAGALLEQRKGDDSFRSRADVVEQFRFEIVRDGHFASGYQFSCGANEAELAMTQAFSAVIVCGAHRRTEDAARHGPPRVHIAAARRGVERRTSGIVGEVCEAGLIFRGTPEHAGNSIPGKIRTIFR